MNAVTMGPDQMAPMIPRVFKGKKGRARKRRWLRSERIPKEFEGYPGIPSPVELPQASFQPTLLGNIFR